MRQKLPPGELKQAQPRDQYKACAKPAIEILGVQLDAHESQLGPQRRIELQVINHLDHCGRTGQGDQRRDAQPQVGNPQLLEFSEGGNTQVHHDQAGQAAGRVHHHEEENQPDVQQPGHGQFRQQNQRQHQQGRTDDGAEEESRTAQERKQQQAAGAHAADHFSRDDF